MGRTLVLLCLHIVCCATCVAQRNEILRGTIASLQAVAGDSWLSLPIIELRGSDPINISFDDFTHEYRRYFYRIEHCEADWSVSEEIFTSDFCEGFANELRIEDVEESMNTNILYTHYSFQIPNDLCRLKISGNYRVTIYDDDAGEDVARVCFMVLEPKMSVGMAATTNTDIGINREHQQVSINLNYENVRVNYPLREIKTIVLQNGRWHNAVYNPTPQYQTNDGMRWEHNRDLIFSGGNEYRKFETLDVTHTTMGLESVDWDGENYHAYVWPDEPRIRYVYDEDANGYFYIRNSDNYENDVASEYLYVHFKLMCPRQNGEIYLNAAWTNDEFSERNRMTYNELGKYYENVQLLKQGYYSYQYIIIRSDGTIRHLPSEGNFYQTENKYQCLVYYKAIGARTDLLVGYGQVELNPPN